MENDNKFYRVRCEVLDTILLVKKLESKEVMTLCTQVSDKLREHYPVAPSSVRMFILQKVLYDYDGFKDSLPYFEDYTASSGRSKKSGLKSDGDKTLAIVYDTVLTVYPALDIDWILDQINDDIAGGILNELRDLFLSTDEVDQAEAEFTPYHSTMEPRGIKTLADIHKAESFLKKNIIGQDKAVSAMVNSLKTITAGLTSQTSLAFVGPTGVGKTQLARLFGERYSGNFYKVNCAEYASAHEYGKLIGAPPGYVGHNERSKMAEMADVSNKWVILFDEIEKAHPKLYNFLLSLQDEGTVCDNLGNELDFSKSIFIFTSNQGVGDLNKNSVGFSNSELSREEEDTTLQDSFKKAFSPEFINRIDDFIFFNSLTEEDCLKIASLSLKELPVKKSKPLLRWIVKHGYSKEYGARNIKRFIKNSITPILADLLLNGVVPMKMGDLYTPKIVQDKLTFVKTHTLDEQA